MAWLTVYDSTNKIDDNESEYEESTFFGGQEWKRTITVTTYRWVGMDLTTADAAAAATSNLPDVVATRKRENAAGAYMVEVTDTTTGTWAV